MYTGVIKNNLTLTQLENFMQANNKANSLSRSSLLIIGILVAVFAIIIVVIGVTTRANNDSNLKEWTNK